MNTETSEHTQWTKRMGILMLLPWLAVLLGLGIGLWKALGLLREHTSLSTDYIAAIDHQQPPPPPKARA